jgi:hypothetical protein
VGFQVCACRPAEAETKLALSAVADLLEGVPEEAFAALPVPQQRALAVALLRVERRAASPDPRTLATAVRSLFAGLSEEGPLLVAVDDVQWLDATSARVLEFALRRLTTARLGWLLVRRLLVPAGLVADGLVPPESLTRATIGPLSLAALHHVLSEQLELTPSRSTSRPHSPRVGWQSFLRARDRARVASCGSSLNHRGRPSGAKRSP